jgi:hypothetical protein
LPLKKACGTDKLRHFWVRQQYRVVFESPHKCLWNKAQFHTAKDFSSSWWKPRRRPPEIRTYTR